jgi:SulP family sulfate permease
MSRALPRMRAVRRWMDQVRPEPGTLVPEAIAGLPGAIGSVPDGMAASLLAGVNPIHGLYASMAGPIVGGLSASTALVVVTTTSAAALAAGSSLASIPSADRAGALALLTLIAGALMVVAGLARVGRYTRFVSGSVMTGFLTGVAANIVLGQIPVVTGVDAEGSLSISKALYVLTHPSQIDLTTLVIGAIAAGVLLVLTRTRLQSVAAFVALVIPSVIVAVAGLERVELVSDVGSIPTGIPLPALPSLRALSPDLIVGAFAVAVIVLVQGSGVSESAPNPDGSRSDANRDFFAQGLGNVAAAMFKGQPVGGSVGQTALNVAAGARTRWASIFSGVWMLVILIALSGLVGDIAMATLAAILIYAAIGSVNVHRIRLVLAMNEISVIASITTFIATLVLPVAAAVGIGVALSLLLQVNRSSLDLRVVELVPLPDGSVREQDAPTMLESYHVTVIDVYGSLLFAGARTLELRLPDPAGTTCPALVIRVRGRTGFSSTAVQVLERYQARLDEVGGRLYLSGVEPSIVLELRKAKVRDAIGPVELVPATDVLGAATREAYERATGWVRERQEHDRS